jgi:hypothetical protein
MEDLTGNNAPAEQVIQDPRAVLEAQIKQFEANQAAAASAVAAPETTADSAAQPQESATPPAPKEEPQGNKDKVPAGFVKEDGSLDEDKIQKSTEHLEKGIEDKSQRITKYKELQRKFTSVSQEAKKEEAKAADFGLQQMKDYNFSPEFREFFKSEYERDPIGALAKLGDAIAEQKVAELRREREQERRERLDEMRLQGLDELASRKGNEWLLTDDGFAKVEKVLSERPYLWQDKNPYEAALRFIDDRPSPAQAPGQAQTGQRTPILSGSRAVPPPSSTQPPSPAQELARLTAEQNHWLAHGNVTKANEIQRQKDELASRAFPATRY